MKLSRRSLLAGTTALTLPQTAWAQEKVVRYGISMADIPLTTGQPDRGAGAYQYHRAHPLRSVDCLGTRCRRPARQDDPGTGHRVEGERGGQDRVDLQAAPRREVP